MSNFWPGSKDPVLCLTVIQFNNQTICIMGIGNCPTDNYSEVNLTCYYARYFISILLDVHCQMGYNHRAQGAAAKVSLNSIYSHLLVPQTRRRSWGVERAACWAVEEGDLSWQGGTSYTRYPGTRAHGVGSSWGILGASGMVGKPLSEPENQRGWKQQHKLD